MKSAIDRGAVQALHDRAKQLVLTMGCLGKSKELSFAQGALCELSALLKSEAPGFLAQRAALMGGYQPLAGFEAAWAALPEGAERYTLAEVQQFLTSHGVEISADAITHGNFYAASGFEYDKVSSVVDIHNEHDAAQADLNDDAGLHTKSIPSVRLHVRGLQIDTQCGKGGVVNLVVRADEEHKSVWSSLRQHIANALFRAGDACHPSNNHGGLRVVLRDMPSATLNDALPQRTNSDIRQVWPIHTANGDAHYMALLVHEGVKRHHDGRIVSSNAQNLCRQKSTDDTHTHSNPRKPPCYPTQQQARIEE